MAVNLVKHDQDLAGSFMLRFNDRTGVEFQFPPKITSDGRKGTWKEKELRGTEPVAVFATSGPREIILAATYIVNGSGKWTADRIHTQIKTVRGYFARVRSAQENTRDLVIQLQMWGIGGPKPMTARLTNIGVKYSDTLVGDKNNAFPLRTDLTLDLRLWSQGSSAQGADAEKVQLIDDLAEREPAEWY